VKRIRTAANAALGAACVLGGVLANPAAAAACSVCFGADSKSPWAASINGGIFVLLGVTAVVLGWFIAVILTIRRRTMRWEARKQALHVVNLADAAGSARKA